MLAGKFACRVPCDFFRSFLENFLGFTRNLYWETFDLGLNFLKESNSCV